MHKDGRKILIADDNANLRRVIEFQLKEAGFRVSTASDGLEALELFMTNQFDCVITDLRMPRLSGWELLQRMKDLNAAVPVIVITGFGDGGTRASVIESAAFEYISKPFSRDEMLSAFDRAFNTSKDRDHGHSQH